MEVKKISCPSCGGALDLDDSKKRGVNAPFVAQVSIWKRRNRTFTGP